MQMVAFKGDVKRSTDAAHRADHSQPRQPQQSDQLSWTNTSTTQTGVKIERSTDNVTFTQITVAGATAVSYSDAGLSALDHLFLSCARHERCRRLGIFNTASATTQAPSPPPTAPTNLAGTASRQQPDQPVLDQHLDHPDGMRSSARPTTSPSPRSPSLAPPAVSYSDVGLSASTTYFYRVRATKQFGDSPYSNTASATTQSATRRTASGPAVLSWPLVAVHMTLLLPARSWLGTITPTTSVRTSSTQRPTPSPQCRSFIADLFCSGHALLPDGRVFVAGGHTGTPHVGIPNSTFFDPSTQSWSSGPSMSVGRWYPSVTSLPDGRMLVTAGETNCDGCNALIPENL